MRQAAARVVAWTVDHWIRLWRAGLRPGSLGGISFALACVCLATTIRILLGEVGPESAAFAPYYSATLVIALVCGWISAAISAFLGGILAYFLFLLPDKDLARGAATEAISLGLYAASSIIIIWAAESHRRLMRLLQDQDQFRRLLSNELAHRVKNTLAVVQTIVRYSVHDQPELRSKLCARIAALAETNDVLMHQQSQGTFLHLIERELAHFGSSRVHVSGTDFGCRRETLTLLSLLIHELATNAAKYGAFATPTGELYLDWSLVSTRLDLEWRECGVTSISPPQSKGFGSKLLEAVAKRFNGSVHLELTDGGLRCKLTVQLSELDSPVAPSLPGDEYLHSPRRPPADIQDTKIVSRARVVAGDRKLFGS